MLYPTYEVLIDHGIIPNIRLPEDFKELVTNFYDQERKADVVSYSIELEKILGNSRIKPGIRLAWHDTLGLTNISVGTHGGLDLNESSCPRFREHNLGGINGVAAGMVATKYVSELLKSRQ